MSGDGNGCDGEKVYSSIPGLLMFSDRVLIKAERLEPGSRMFGSIVIPDNVEDQFQYGEVIGIGEGRFDRYGRNIEMLVNVGDMVLIDKYTGTEISFDGEKYLMIPQVDLLARVEPELGDV